MNICWPSRCEGLAPATVQRYRHAIGRFARFVGEIDPATIDATLLRRFVKLLAEEGCATATQAAYLLSVKRWSVWLADEGGYGVDQRHSARAKSPRIIQHNGAAITRDGFQMMLKRLSRRTFAILALRAGMNPFVLMHILGYRDMTMTRRYLNIIDSDGRDQKRAASPLDKIKF